MRDRGCYIPTDDGAREAHCLLSEWGRLLRRYGDTMPEDLGWPGRSVEQMLLRDGGRGGSASFTLPEAALAQLERDQRAVITIGSLVFCLDPLRRTVLYLFYVERLHADEIASALDKCRATIYSVRRKSIEQLWDSMIARLPLAQDQKAA